MCRLMTEHTFFKVTLTFSTNDLKPTGKKDSMTNRWKKTTVGHKTYARFSTNNGDKRLKIEFVFDKDNEEEVYL